MKKIVDLKIMTSLIKYLKTKYTRSIKQKPTIKSHVKAKIFDYLQTYNLMNKVINFIEINKLYFLT